MGDAVVDPLLNLPCWSCKDEIRVNLINCVAQVWVMLCVIDQLISNGLELDHVVLYTRLLAMTWSCVLSS